MSRVIKADIRFQTVTVPRKRALISPFPLLYSGQCGRAGNSTVSLCVISKLTELLSFEGDTQIIKQTRIEKITFFGHKANKKMFFVEWK
jgi:hypothetical protein